MASSSWVTWRRLLGGRRSARCARSVGWARSMRRPPHVADERAVGGVHREPERLVEAHGGHVGGVDVQHADRHAGRRQVLQPGDGQLAAEAEAVEVGVDGDDVDLAQLRVAVWAGLRRVDLGPAEAGQPPVALVQEESAGVEPWLVLAVDHVVARPPSLFLVAGEGPVVHLQPGVLVAAGDERPDGQVGPHGERERDPHLVERATRCQPQPRRRPARARRSARRPTSSPGRRRARRSPRGWRRGAPSRPRRGRRGRPDRRPPRPARDRCRRSPGRSR